MLELEIKSTESINLLFAGTINYLKYINVTVLSTLENLKGGTIINVFFLYADIIKTISDEERRMYFETTEYFFKDKNVKFKFIDVTDKIYIFKNLNVVAHWGREISMSHYVYLLAPEVLKDIDKAIYIDCDIIVNCNLYNLFNIELNNKLAALASPSGFEIEKNTSNSGFIILNLKLWRQDNTLTKMIAFGETLSASNLCDQYLLNEYFKKEASDKLLLIDKKYNLFPMFYPEMNIDDIKILHYASLHKKPWSDLACTCRGSFLWWQYARKTAFYEVFLNDYISKLLNSKEEKEKEKLELKYTFVERIFSVKNLKTNNKIFKVITILGIRIKFQKRNKK